MKEYCSAYVGQRKLVGAGGEAGSESGRRLGGDPVVVGAGRAHECAGV